MASIVLFLSHPLLGHPEATVRTQFVGQSRNLWIVGGHGLGILASKGLSSIIISGSGETESTPDEKPLCNFARGQLGVGRDRDCARRRPPCDLGQRGAERRLPWKEPP